MIDWLPSRIWLATFSITSGCRAGSLLELAWPAVDHDVRLDLGLVQRLFAQRNADRIIVGLAVAAAQYHVTVGIALGGDDGNAAFLVDTQEAMRAGGLIAAR